MDAKELSDYSISKATSVVMQVRDDDLDNRTPNDEWNVRDLLGHTMSELAWMPDILAGKTPAEVGSAHDNMPTKDFGGDWEDYMRSALDSVDDAVLTDTVHLSYGDVKVEDYLWQAASDQLIHAWDLGKAINQPITFDETVSQEMYNYAYEHKQEREDSGMFGDEIPVSADANIQTRLLALYGRDDQDGSAGTVTESI